MKIIVNQLALEYQDQGTGQVMLFLHGWQDNLHTFDHLIPLLPGYRLVRLDLPGFGLSQLPPLTWTLKDYAECVQTFVQKLKLEVAVVVGHSFGGRVALKSISTHLISPQQLVLIGCAGVAQRNTLRNSVFKVLAKVGKALVFIPPFIFWRKQLRAALYRRAGSDYLTTGALKDIFMRVIAEDLSGAAQQVVTPSLLIWGAEDAATPLVEGQRLATLMPQAQLKVISGAGHFVHVEQPAAVAQLIQEFLAV
jgi:pimeloyl-ACP methyl ester carboxylesterase